MANGPIQYRNQNYLKTTKEPIKGHLMAEDFDAIQIHAANQQAQIAALQAQVASLLAKSKL